MLNEFVHPEGKLFVPGAPATVPRLAAVLAACRRVGLPVVHAVRQHRPDGSDVETVRREAFRRLGGFCLPGSWGAEITPELTPLPQETIVVKHGWSAFLDTGLNRFLRRLQVDTLIVGGTQTPNCVRATLYDATARGYSVILLGDGTSAATPEIQEANLHDLAALGTPIVDCADLCQSLREGWRGIHRPKAYLRAVLPEERAQFTRTVLETIRQGDLPLDTALRIPLVAWWARRVLHYLYHRHSRPLVLEVGGAPAGFLVLRARDDALRIEALGVLPAFRRQGWGQWLLEHAEREARRMGLDRLVLEVFSGNKPALDLYWQARFRPTPRRWRILHMEKTLASGKEQR